MNKVGIFKSIQFKFVLIYTLLILLAMQLIGVFFSDRMEKSSIGSFQTQLVKQTDLLTNSISEAISDIDQGDRDKLIAKVQEQLTEVNDPKQTIQIYDTNGVLLGTTEPDHFNDIRKQTADPNIRQELKTLTKPKPGIYQNPKTHERMMYVMEPIKVRNAPSGLLYLEKSLSPRLSCM